jgi:transposase InsO family protein
MNYMIHLNIQGKMPKAIHMDHDREFVNEALFRWCQSKGMEIQMTAPYSPSQNGVAEWMNCMLEELAQAMQIATDLPMFLWEQVIAHAAYVRNRAYSSAIKVATPYEC